MSDFLDQYGKYGAGEARREKAIKTIVLSALVLAIVGGILFFIFHNYSQERQAKRFFAALASHDYQGAYAIWGCTEAKPCSGYPYSSFLQDWGPQSGHADVSGFRIARSRSCGSGVILTVDFQKGQEEKLWVERGDLTMSYSPLPGCPAR
jgi:hypothetical protein